MRTRTGARTGRTPEQEATLRTLEDRIRRVRTSRRFARVVHEDDGLSTAEYAVGTVAVAGLGGLLFKLLTSDAVRDLIWGLISRALSVFLG